MATTTTTLDRSPAALAELRAELPARVVTGDVQDSLDLLNAFQKSEREYTELAKQSRNERITTETLQLASELGLTNPDTVYKYCSDNLGVDCGGFVAAYWGEGVPHMADTQPVGSLGFLPRTFWSDSHLWPDVRARRRKSAGEISPGDAAIFFKDIKGDDPDIAKQRDGNGKLIEGTGSEAFHIGLVNGVSGGGDKITQLEIAESSGAASKFGSDGVNVRFATIQASGIARGLVYAQTGANERIYFLGPPAGWGPELPYTYGEE